MAQGCDVSFAQVNLDYPQLAKAGVQFAWAKLLDWGSRGYFWDVQHDKHKAGMRAAGVLTGDYAFFHTTPDPIEFADRFCEACSVDELPPVLDVETLLDGKIPPDVGARALVCLKRIEQNLGLTPILYSYVPYLTEMGRQAPGLAKYPLWVARYLDPPSPDHLPKVPAPWGSDRLWCYQWTGHGRLPGCAGEIDRDVMVKPIEDVMVAVVGSQLACQPSPLSGPSPNRLPYVELG